jgi:hypothetical protein
MKRLTSRLTYANVVSSLALFLVLAGGSAFAASQLGKNSVGSKQIKKGAVTAAKIKNGAVTSAKLDPKTMATLAGPQGPKGEPGAPGAPGSPGSALGYAHLVENKLDASRSKGVVGIAEGETEGGIVNDTVVCFDLAFVPSSISVTPDAPLTSSTPIPSFWAGAVPANEPRPSHAGCPEAFSDAEVEATTEAGDAPNGVWVAFF